MNFYKSGIHHRRTVRLKDYDYSKAGLYFITICCMNRKCLFGKITVGGQNLDSLFPARMILNNAGKIADEYWLQIPMHYPNVILHEYVIMPNHVHGIIEITNIESAGGQDFDPLQPKRHIYQKTIPRSIGAIVRGYKIGVTKWFRQNTNIHDPWQRDFYEIIIRNNESRQRIANYILQNPEKWFISRGSRF